MQRPTIYKNYLTNQYTICNEENTSKCNNDQEEENGVTRHSHRNMQGLLKGR